MGMLLKRHRQSTPEPSKETTVRPSEAPQKSKRGRKKRVAGEEKGE